MVRIYDAGQIERAMKALQVEASFDCRNLTFCLCRFSKGELISSPLKQQTDFLFLYTGKTQFYALRTDGQLLPVSMGVPGTVIGDVELAGQGNSGLYAHALTETLCLALNLRQNREALNENISFWRFVCKSLCSKVYLVNPREQVAVSVEEKLRLYLQTHEKMQTLSGITELSKTLGCSRRQLERVIGKLCRQGMLISVSKGHYLIKG